TLPANDTEILIGKYLSVVAVYSIALLFSTALWAVLATYADPGFRMFLSTYLGYWLAGSSLLAVGMFASSLTRSSTVAFVLGAIFCAVPVFLSSSTLNGTMGFLEAALNSDGETGWLESMKSLTALSIGDHLREFSLGVVRLSSVLYFESLAFLFLYMNLVVITKRHWVRRQQWNMGLQYLVRSGCVLTVLISFYVVVTQSTGRADIDLTPQKYFTLSDATTEVLDNIESDRPVTIQAFLSPDVPTDYVRTKRRLEGLLRQIDQGGGKRVELRMIDTTKYSPTADEAKSFGIEPRRVSVEEDGKDVIEDVYLGLVISSSYDEVVIPFVGRGTPLEFEITRALRTVSNAHRMTVGILETGARVMSNPQTEEFLQELRKQYHVESASADSPIEREKQLFAIEDESVVKDLEKSEEAKVTEGLQELFKKKNTPLSADVQLSYNSKTEDWILRDRRVNRKYRIHRIAKEENSETESETPKEDEKAEEKTKAAEPKYAVSIDRYDCLVAVLPSTLTQSQMRNFVKYVKDSGPTLILDDPLPVSLQPYEYSILAPSLNAQQGFPFGMEPRADGGSASSLMEALNLTWNNNEVAWDLYNPFIEYESGWRQGVNTVVGNREGVPEAVNEKSSVTQGLGRLVLLYSGEISERTPDKMSYTPLLKSSKDLSGVFEWNEVAVTRRLQAQDPMTRRPTLVEYFQILNVEESLPVIDTEGLSEEEKARALKGSGFRTDSQSHVFAAHIRGKGESQVNTIFVADADMIGDQFFQLRREKYMKLDLDNVSFILNAIDVLAGEDAFLELRRRKQPQPPLTEIETYKKTLRENQRKAIEQARQTMLTKQQELKKIRDDLEKEINQQGYQSLSQTL
ncbi:MAG: Gldg family protein, partial [Planctomycetaceae bacterium]|nr:Gldg family protein [Planctomycetaceae bacterium]